MGRRAANQTAVTFAAIGTAACGLSNSMEMLIIARFVSSFFSFSCMESVLTDRIQGCGNGRGRCVHDSLVSSLLLVADRKLIQPGQLSVSLRATCTACG